MSRILLYGKLPHEGSDAYAKHAQGTLRVLSVVAKFAMKEGTERYVKSQVFQKIDEIVLDSRISKSQAARQIMSVLSVVSLYQKFPQLLNEIEEALEDR